MVDGDHSFKPRKSAGRTEQQNWEQALAEIETSLKTHHAEKKAKRRT
jgi:hypothetical protein